MNTGYVHYIGSKKWKDKREEVFSKKKFKGRCFCCGKKFTQDDSPQIHHKHYKRFKEENAGADLIPVCRKCHIKIHSLNKRFKIALEQCHFVLKRIYKTKKKIQTIKLKLKKGCRLSVDQRLRVELGILEKELEVFESLPI